MPRLILVALLLAMLTAVPVAAQDNAYRLRKAPADEYFGAIPGVIAAWQEQMPVSYTKVSINPVVEVMLYELQQGYSEADMFAQDFATLSSAYDSMRSITFAYNPIKDGTTWAEAMLQAWLRENPVDLAEVDSLDIPGFSVLVSPIDFDGDGTDEFGLQVGFDGLYDNYLVLQRDSSQAGGYRFVETPLSWLGFPTYSETGSSKEYEVLYLEDMNGDHVPEWVVRSYDAGCSTLYIMTWKDGALVSLLPDEPTSCLQNQYFLANADDDPDLELVRREFDADNWDCAWTITRHFDWNGVHFEPLAEQVDKPNSLGCALSEAEPLMWENRAAEAIPLYEVGLDAGWVTPIDDDSDYYAELERYARIRLALAYALVGRWEESLQILEPLATEPATSEALDKMVSGMLQTESPLEMCTAAYNLWAEYELSTFYYPFSVISIQIGSQDYFRSRLEDSPPQPEKAGCNAPELIDRLLEELDFPTSQSPVSVLADSGIGVLNTFVADFDADGADEWLVWLEARVTPLLFAPQGGEYILSRPEVRRPNEFTHFGSQSVPDQDDLLFVDYVALKPHASNLDFYYYDVAEVYCAEGTNPGEVRIWRLENHTFAQVLIAPVCQPRAFADLFNEDGSQLFAAAVSVISVTNSFERYGDTVYSWDSNQQMYMPQLDLPLTATPYPTSASSEWPGITDAAILDILTDSLRFIRNDDPAAALAQIDDALANHDPMVDEIATLGLRYYRAVALEALNRPDEALAEYAALVETVPDSCWGMLARLHIEVVDGG